MEKSTKTTTMHPLFAISHLIQNIPPFWCFFHMFHIAFTGSVSNSLIAKSLKKWPNWVNNILSKIPFHRDDIGTNIGIENLDSLVASMDQGLGGRTISFEDLYNLSYLVFGEH